MSERLTRTAITMMRRRAGWDYDKHRKGEPIPTKKKHMLKTINTLLDEVEELEKAIQDAAVHGTGIISGDGKAISPVDILKGDSDGSD